MSATVHHENAHFLRSLAENLFRLNWREIGAPSPQPEQLALLQRLANDELAEAEHEEWIKAKVRMARADLRPPLSTEQIRARIQSKLEGKQDAS